MNNPAAANRVAVTIATFKWIVIGIIGLGVVIMFIAGLASGDASGVGLAFAAMIGGAVYAVIFYVLFGWFEQTLRMLADISTATAAMAGLRHPSSPPPPPYGS